MTGRVPARLCRPAAPGSTTESAWLAGQLRPPLESWRGRGKPRTDFEHGRPTWPFRDDLRRFGPGTSERASRAEALAYCAGLTATHYENFSVVTWLTPREHRPAFQSIYAFCRWSDDLGDEVGDPGESLELLDWWRGELRAMYRGEARHPVMIALAETVERYGIPIEPFEALISAFEQDQTVTEYLTYEQLLDYCTRSANPVGHLVLYVAGAFSTGERATGRRDLHGAATGELLAGRGPRPGDRPDLPAARGSGSLRLSRVRPAGLAIHAGVRRADEVRGRADPRPCSPKVGPWCRGFRGRLAVDVDLFSRGGWRSSTGSRPAGSTSCGAGRPSARWTKLRSAGRARSRPWAMARLAWR